ERAQVGGEVVVGPADRQEQRGRRLIGWNFRVRLGQDLTLHKLLVPAPGANRQQRGQRGGPYKQPEQKDEQVRILSRLWNLQSAPASSGARLRRAVRPVARPSTPRRAAIQDVVALRSGRGPK